MKTVRYGVAVGMLAGLGLSTLGACSNMMGHGNDSAASRPAAAATAPTMAPDMVKQVQAKLRDSGYYKQGNVDGVWGSGTENAVRSFQHDHNLGSSGQLDVPTLQALNVTRAPAAANGAATNNTAPTQPSTVNANAPTNGNPNAAANGNANPPTNANPNPPPADNTAPGPSR